MKTLAWPTAGLFLLALEAGCTTTVEGGGGTGGAAPFGVQGEQAACAGHEAVDDCDRCVEASCCEEYQTLAADPYYQIWMTCVEACTTRECSDLCSDAWATNGAQASHDKFWAHVDCELKACPNLCD
ncbi:MAG: hypothetical protein KC492_02615 [Myxococcales bacterium]|nr:hypothetical protein [Myxococcales bacterium]